MVWIFVAILLLLWFLGFLLKVFGVLIHILLVVVLVVVVFRLLTNRRLR